MGKKKSATTTAEKKKNARNPFYTRRQLNMAYGTKRNVRTTRSSECARVYAIYLRRSRCTKIRIFIRRLLLIYCYQANLSAHSKHATFRGMETFPRRWRWWRGMGGGGGGENFFPHLRFFLLAPHTTQHFRCTIRVFARAPRSRIDDKYFTHFSIHPRRCQILSTRNMSSARENEKGNEKFNRPAIERRAECEKGKKESPHK